jgi:hypothetical protein
MDGQQASVATGLQPWSHFEQWSELRLLAPGPAGEPHFSLGLPRYRQEPRVA